MDIEELSRNPIYSHAVFGCFGKTHGLGHRVCEMKGKSPNIKKYADSEREYGELFKNEVLSPEFKIRIHGETIPEGFKLKLIYNDRQGDKRGSSHTDYMLIVPKQEVQRIIPSMLVPWMIPLFQKVFPTYDRSNGRLTLDSNHGTIIYP